MAARPSGTAEVNLANNLTVLRILLTPVFIGSLIYYSPERSFFIYISIAAFLTACVTDGLDGLIARRLNQKTTLGSYIDPLADKFLLLSAFSALSFMPNLPVSIRIPAWVTIIIITRDLLILLGSILIFLTTGRLKAEPLFIGKLTTVFQMMALLASLIAAPDFIRHALFLAAVGLTAVSGLFYIRMGGRILQSS